MSLPVATGLGNLTRRLPAKKIFRRLPAKIFRGSLQKFSWKEKILTNLFPALTLSDTSPQGAGGKMIITVS